MQLNARLSDSSQRPRVGVLLGLGVLFLSELLFAQQPPPESKQGAIAGSIIHSQSGKPLQNATLNLSRLDTRPVVVYGRGPVPAPTPTQWSTTSDERGKYEFLDLEPGRYSLSAQLRGYGSPESTVSSASILLSAGERVTGVEMTLTPKMSISGRLVDEAGQPVPLMGVTLLMEQYLDGHKQLYPIRGGFVQTNERGEFEYAGVWKGSMVLEFAPIRLFQPSPPGVTDAAPNLGYVTTYYPGTTDVSQAARIDVAPGVQRSGLEGRILKGRVSRIKGWVQDHTGQRVTNAGVILKPTSVPWDGTMRAHATQAPDGAFEFQHVLPGSHRLIVKLDDLGMIHRESITVGSQDIDNLEVRLPVPVNVEGEILFKANLRVDPRDVSISLDPHEEGAGGLPPARITASDGMKLFFYNVFPGKYRISAHLWKLSVPDGPAYVERIQYGDQEVTDAPVEITARPSRLRVTFNGGTGSATGMVTKNKAPARKARVLLLSANESRRLGQVWTKTAWTDEKARFVVENLPPGDYLAFAFEETEEGFWRDAQRFKQFASKAKKVSIEKDGSANLNLEVMPLPQG